MNWDGMKRKRTRRKKVKQKIREPCHSNAHEGGGDTSCHSNAHGGGGVTHLG